MIVDVYVNLHKTRKAGQRIYSVRSVKTGRVVDHLSRLVLMNPRFSVQQGGRAKVNKTKRKNVHAFVRGELDNSLEGLFLFDKLPKRVSYNPYRLPFFFDVTDESPVKSGVKAILDESGVLVWE